MELLCGGWDMSTNTCLSPIWRMVVAPLLVLWIEKKRERKMENKQGQKVKEMMKDGRSYKSNAPWKGDLPALLDRQEMFLACTWSNWLNGKFINNRIIHRSDRRWRESINNGRPFVRVTWEKKLRVWNS